MTNNERQGFTLIEILIVVAIIAILASVVLVGLGPTQQSGRDARRLSDLHEVQNALELYYNKCGYYPGTYIGSAPCTGFVASGGYNQGTSPVVTVITGSSIGVGVMPDDPTSGKHYLYDANTGGASYILEAELENVNNSVFTSYTPPSTTGYTNGDSSLSCPTVGGSGFTGQYCITL